MGCDSQGRLRLDGAEINWRTSWFLDKLSCEKGFQVGEIEVFFVGDLEETVV